MSHNAKAKRQIGSLTFIAVLVFASVSTSAFSQSSAKSVEELPPGAMKVKASAACLGCHEARIIVQQRLTKAAWTKEVDKMMKWGAAVDASDHDDLIDYLTTNFNTDKAPYEAPRTSLAKGSRK